MFKTLGLLFLIIAFVTSLSASITVYLSFIYR